MAGIIDTFKLGLRSLGEDAARAAFARETAQDIIASKKAAAVTGGISARELADAYPNMQAEASKFIDDFHAAYKQPEFSNLPDAVAYGAGRKLGGINNGVGNMVQGMGGVPGVALQAAFLAPMVAPMFMQQQEQQSADMEDYNQLLAHARQQQMQQQGYQ